MTRIARRTRWIAPTLALLVLLMGAFGIASAAEQHHMTPSASHTNYTELEQQYRLRQAQVRSLDAMLTRDERRSAEVATLITRAKAAGVNTAALEQALVTYRAKLVDARAAWQTASATLKTHAGFSDAGKVTNPDQARTTIKAAASALEQSYKTAQSAEELLNKALAAIHTHK